MAKYEVELEKLADFVTVEIDDNASVREIEIVAIDEATRKAKIFTLKEIDD